MAEALPPGVLNVVNGPDAAPRRGAGRTSRRRHGLVHRRRGDGPSRHGTAAAHDPAGRARARRATTPPSSPPTSWSTPDLADRLVEAAFVTSGQVCMAIKRLYVHRDRLDETVDALVDRLSIEVVGDGLADGVTMGPVHTAERSRPGRGISSPRPKHVRRQGPSSGPGPCRGRGAGGYFVSPALVEAPPPTSRIVPRGAVRAGPAGHPLRRLDEAVRGSQRHAVRPVRIHLEQRRRAGLRAWPHRSRPGRSSSTPTGISAIDMYAPMGGWKQSGFGVELGPEGMQAFARPAWSRCAPAWARVHGGTA